MNATRRPAPLGAWARVPIFSVLVLGAVTAGSAAALAAEATLPLSLAEEAAKAALAHCRAGGYRVSVAVVGREGRVKVLIRGDGAGPHTLDSSRKKAYTALTLRRATADLVRLVEKRRDAAGLRDMNADILILGGGLPIRAGDEVIGGIGVGGAPGGTLDEACAKAGIEKIKDRLR